MSFWLKQRYHWFVASHTAAKLPEVSVTKDGQSSFFQYNFGKSIQDQAFKTAGFLNQPPTDEETINKILDGKKRLRKKYKRPDRESDTLFQTRVVHPSNESATCKADCNTGPLSLEPRPDRTDDDDDPATHYGTIASANQLMKDAIARDKLAGETGVLCFEMEAAGLMNHFPCLVIRGICDYSDSHKNKEWQGYATMTAAAYAKDLLARIPPNKIENERTIINDAIMSTDMKVTALTSNSEREQEREILDWLSPIDYDPNQSDTLIRRELGTRQWTLNSPEYQSWLSGDQTVLFCPGIPGAGKTVLTSVVINGLLGRLQHVSDNRIVYIYFNYQLKNEQTATDLIASLMKQLAEAELRCRKW
ncbi:hypothetical protein EDB81DRAFT_887025 [Dactylonectria macrodidyma]|uniref:Nephrocystin 3-like N-terminal domain-containing protein n=1 Tax=Dactylonectria macrodidyma TaxID=307937 RepID=A0A9P9E9A2_9HYPO|nr:hypothetical protein EDB81DRAFT_887025 [Dactylonectria macrodidyma]